MPIDENQLRELLSRLNTEAFEEVASSLDGLPGTDALDPYLFLLKASEYARDWLKQRHENELGDLLPCAFVLSRSLEIDVAKGDYARFLGLGAILGHSISGHLILTVSNLRMGYGRFVQDADEQQILEQIVDLGFESRPAVLLIPGSMTLVLFPDGVIGTATRHQYEIASLSRKDPGLSLSGFDEVLKRFHSETTETPNGAMPPLKQPASERITLEDLERRIRKVMAMWIRLQYGEHLVQSEVETAHGNIDVLLQPGFLSSELGSALLELKVLRSRLPSRNTKGYTTVSDRKNLQNALKGIQQAVDYRSDIKANIAYLCCFDARFKNKDIEPVMASAAEKDVFYRRYYIYTSVGEYRQAAMK